MKPVVAKGDIVEVKTILAKSKETKQKVQSTHPGRIVKITGDMIVVEDIVPEKVQFEIPTGRNILIREGDPVKIGMKLIEGHINLQSLMDIA